MRTPQIPPLAGMTPLGFKEPTRAVNEKTLAERKWQSPKLAAKPQKPCDVGLFSDELNQLDMVEMFQDPTNE